MRVADLGCGTGSTTAWFAAQVGSEGEVCTVDFSSEQLAIAERKANAEGLNNVRFLRASADATGLPRDSFDVVHCRLLLCHVTNPLEVVREMMAITNTLLETRPVMLQYGMSSAEEFDGVAKALAAVASVDTCAVAQTPLVACWAQK